MGVVLVSWGEDDRLIGLGGGGSGQGWADYWDTQGKRDVSG